MVHSIGAMHSRASMIGACPPKEVIAMLHPRDLTSFAPEKMAALDRLIPAIWSDAWGDFARVFFVGLVNSKEIEAPAELLARIAVEQVLTLGYQLGGASVYVPRGAHIAQKETAERICKEFRGNNYIELAVKYGLTESSIRNVINAAKKANGLAMGQK